MKEDLAKVVTGITLRLASGKPITKASLEALLEFEIRGEDVSGALSGMEYGMALKTYRNFVAMEVKALRGIDSRITSETHERFIQIIQTKISKDEETQKILGTDAGPNKVEVVPSYKLGETAEVFSQFNRRLTAELVAIVDKKEHPFVPRHVIL